MALRRRGGTGDGLNAWPGYVDALSTLLMVIIFVLLVFVLAQAFLSVALSGRDRALDRLNRQMAELSDMLSLERGRSAELRLSIAQLSRDLQGTTSARDTLAQQLAALRAEQEQLTADRDTLKSDRDRLSARLADTALLVQSAQARANQLQAQVAELAQRSDASGQDAATTAAQLAETRRLLAEMSKRADASVQQATTTAALLADTSKRADASASQLADTQKRLTDASTRADTSAQQLADTMTQLADARQLLMAAQSRLDEMQRQAVDLDRTVKADRATIEARLSDLARMAEQTRALIALRDDLERQARDAAARATTEEQRRAAVAAQLADEQKLGDSARAQIALLNRQLEQLRAQMASLNAALEASETSGKNKDVQIANLGSRLNAALAQKVEELQRYRSDFFGKLRQVLANRPGIQVVGDRFVFQSEVLFPVGSADLSVAGWEQIKALAATLLDISKKIPPEVNWILRVDGHADRQPVQNDRFPSNWELSTARAITVVKLLIASGVPANRLAATGFGDNQPLDAIDTPEAYAKNRRIELRLTDR
jgi:chemotaxis protein MotB